MDIDRLRNLLPEEASGSDVFISTRDNNKKAIHYSWQEVIEKGLAPDYGLFLPVAFPVFDNIQIHNLIGLKYSEMAWVILRQFLPEEDISNMKLAELCTEAYKEITIPIEEVPQDKLIIARLDRGPTASFKDFAARFLSRLMSYHLNLKGKDTTIIVATSGDTGTAIQMAFHKVPHTNVLVLYPCEGVSEIQEKQMLSIKENVRAIPINGNFDDCQRIAKILLHDSYVREKFNLTSANSISIWRLLPQIVYYFYIWSQWKKVFPGRLMSFSVPSGNLGNLTAGLIAKRMGLPTQMFIAGTNANNIFANIVGKGTSLGSLSFRHTSASAMDISIPSNLERILYIYGESPIKIPKILNGEVELSKNVFKNLRNDIFAEDIVTNEDMEAHILRFWEKYKILLEPHGSVGVAASFRYRQYFNDYDTVITVLETASPAKFSDKIEKLGCEISIPPHPSIASLSQIDINKIRPKRVPSEPKSVVKELEKLTGLK